MVSLNSLSMKIQYASDLHLEFTSNQRWLTQYPIIPAGEILILAGDTYYLNKDFSQLPFLQKISEQFDEVWLLPGNHEFYGGEEISAYLEPVNKLLFANVRLLSNTVMVRHGISFIFTTLWSHIAKEPGIVAASLTDFHRINYRGKLLTIKDYNSMFRQCLHFLEDAIRQCTTDKKVIITHHLPSPVCNAPEFKNSKINEAFCNDLTDLVERSGADYWLYGHSHRNVAAMIGKTQLLSNQLGYVDYGEHLTFKPDVCFEI